MIEINCEGMGEVNITCTINDIAIRVEGMGEVFDEMPERNGFDDTDCYKSRVDPLRHLNLFLFTGIRYAHVLMHINHFWGLNLELMSISGNLMVLWDQRSQGP
ncbi:hypothetical protein Droror1_Dr00023543 [Drosera rotundifolia]